MSEDVASWPVQPKFIGPYKVESFLEKGGMSFVYLGTHPQTKEPVILKVLSPRFIANSEVVQRFKHEAEIIAMSDHPNIVKLYEFGEWEYGFYIAMEFVQGISLRQYLLQTPMSLKKSLEIIIDVAYAICHLHTHGVIHRDLKPENILVTENGSIKVIDFGIAQLLTNRQAASYPAKQRFIGTPIYMSPEQRENPDTVSYPSDIYSLGIISYELILGKLSHGKVHIGLMPKGIQKILNKALQYRPSERYQDIVDFVADITSYLNSTHILKEKKVGDQLSELSENLKKAQSLLAPTEPPFWPQIEIGIANYFNVNIHNGVLYEFFRFADHSYAIFLAESREKGVEAITSSSLLKGMLFGIKKNVHSQESFITNITTLLVENNMNIFNMSFLVLKPSDKQFIYYSLGESFLWQSGSKDNDFKRIHPSKYDEKAFFSETVVDWQADDLLLLSTIDSLPTMDDDFYEENARTYSNRQPAQQIADEILRKIKVNSNKQLLDRSITLLCVHQNAK